MSDGDAQAQRDYFKRRASEEARVASSCQCPEAAALHARLAELFLQQAVNPKPPRTENSSLAISPSMPRDELCHPSLNTEKVMARELIDTGADKRFDRRDKNGQFMESDDVGRSLAQTRSATQK